MRTVKRNGGGATLLALTVVCTVIAVSGCFRYEQTVVFDADGTADVTVSYSVPGVLAGEEPDIPPTPLPDAYGGDEITPDEARNPSRPNYEDETAALRAAFRRFGLEVADAAVFKEGDFLTYRVNGTVADAGALGSVLSYFDRHETEYKSNDKSVRFREVIENKLPKKGLPTDEEKPLLESLFPDCGFTFRVVMPEPVKEANGIVGADGRTVEWRFGLAEFLFSEKVEMFAEAGIE
jgi:hypothetical protein